MRATALRRKSIVSRLPVDSAAGCARSGRTPSSLWAATGWASDGVLSLAAAAEELLQRRLRGACFLTASRQESLRGGKGVASSPAGAARDLRGSRRFSSSSRGGALGVLVAELQSANWDMSFTTSRRVLLAATLEGVPGRSPAPLDSNKLTDARVFRGLIFACVRAIRSSSFTGWEMSPVFGVAGLLLPFSERPMLLRRQSMPIV
mmetsp:Transcript_2005/g.5914  ORF Transcript_2005/g.5914 Transcript_2005/m.5914 type:complete len:205 (+) Transcript_2005:729-1343(+)